MPLGLHNAHRLAQVNYTPRTLAFGYTFITLWALAAESGGSPLMLAMAALQFLVYPHLAYLHARIATDSKRAELRNMAADALALGAWVAQIQYALWPTCAIVAAVCLNSTSTGGLARLARTVGLFGLGALAWGAVAGYRFHPATGPLVSFLSGAGIIVYTSYIGQILFDQNARLLRTRDALRNSDEQFRFIAEYAGDLVAVLDSKHLFRYASASHARYFDPWSFAPGQRWLDLVHPDDRMQARYFLDLIAGSPSRERVHLRMLAAEGTGHIMECHGKTVWDDRRSVQMVVLVLKDIEARVRTDVESQLSPGPQGSDPGITP